MGVLKEKPSPREGINNDLKIKESMLPQEPSSMVKNMARTLATATAPEKFRLDIEQALKSAL